jgi:hypothetical protein
MAVAREVIIDPIMMKEKTLCLALSIGSVACLLVCAIPAQTSPDWSKFLAEVDRREHVLRMSEIRYLEIVTSKDGGVFSINATKVYIVGPCEKWLRVAVDPRKTLEPSLEVGDLSNFSAWDSGLPWRVHAQLESRLSPSITIISNGRTVILSPGPHSLWEGRITANVVPFERRGALMAGILYQEEWLSDLLPLWKLLNAACDGPTNTFVLRSPTTPSRTLRMTTDSSKSYAITLMETWEANAGQPNIGVSELGVCRSRVEILEHAQYGKDVWLPSRAHQRLAERSALDWRSAALLCAYRPTVRDCRCPRMRRYPGRRYPRCSCNWER